VTGAGGCESGLPEPEPSDRRGSTPRGSDSLLEVLNEAADEGFAAQFVALPDGLVECVECGASSPSSAFELVGYRRLEGVSDPADMLLVAWVRCPRCGAHGTLTLGYGPNASESDASILHGLDLHGADPSPGLEMPEFRNRAPRER
jgi:hypothetical protein